MIKLPADLEENVKPVGLDDIENIPIFKTIPAAAQMWDWDKNNVDPAEVLPKSNKKYWWKCAEGHSFKRTAASFGISSACPICRKVKESVYGKPWLLKFWDYSKNTLDPKQTSAKSSEKAYWKCPDCGYEWKTSIIGRTNNQKARDKCPCCGTGMVTVPGINDFRTKYPLLALDTSDELNPDVDLNHQGVGSHIRINWRCHVCGYEWKAPIYGRIRRDTKPYRVALCPACGKNVRTQTFSEQYPELAALYSENNSIPFDEATGNDYQKKFIWICQKHGEFEASLSSMIRAVKTGNNGCPYCHGIMVKREESFGTKHPDLVKEWSSENDVSPFEVPEHSKMKAKWVCDKGHTWSASVNTRAYGYAYCSKCYPFGKNGVGFAEKFPETEKYYCSDNDTQFTKLVLSDTTLRKWKCEEGHIFEDSCYNISQRGHWSCLICSGRKIVTGVNDFATSYPEYVSFYDNEKNSAPANLANPKDSDPSTWWICDKGHHFQRSIALHIRWNGVCPVCSRHVLQKGANDLLTAYPQIEKLWDYDQNDKEPDEVFDTLTNSYYFQCEKGHSFTCAVQVLVNADFHCLICEGIKLDPEENSLLAVNPKLAEEWDDHDKKPSEVLPTASYVAVWKCPKCGGTYRYRVGDRSVGDDTCPYCNGDRILAGYNDLATTDPQLATEWAPDNDRAVTSIGKNYKYLANWICPKCGGEYGAVVAEREYGDDSCPYCSNRRVLTGFNDLKTADPELATEYSPDNPVPADRIMRTSGLYAHWICPKCGGDYTALPRKRYVGDDSCPYCRGTVIKTGFNELKTTNPELAAEWADDRPIETVKKEFAYIAKWKCPKCGGIYPYAVNLRQFGDDSCPYCNDGRLLAGLNDLATTDPELAAEWSPNNGRTVAEVKKNYKYLAKWICPKCGGEYSAMVADRRVGDDACPFCNNTALLIGYNDLATTDPGLAAEWAPDNDKNVNSVMKNYTFRANWICPKCENEYSAMVKDRTYGDNACPYCSGTLPMPGRDDLASQAPELMKEWSPRNTGDPAKIFRTAKTRYLWICPNCHGEYAAPLVERYEGDDSCPYCKGAKVLRGFNDIATMFPDEIKSNWCEAENALIGVLASNHLKNSSVKAWWKCPDCGRKYYQTIKAHMNFLHRHQKSCPYCKGRRQDPVHFM